MKIKRVITVWSGENIYSLGREINKEINGLRPEETVVEIKYSSFGFESNETCTGSELNYSALIIIGE